MKVKTAEKYNAVVLELKGNVMGGDDTKELKLANVTDKIQSLLVITKLITIFEYYNSVDEAVNSFSAS
ncbi:MAG: hypothetical protein P8Z35_10170 [Ignavibacteriaceae bacterium]